MFNKKEIIEQLKTFTKVHSMASITNDWYHVQRVTNLSFMFAKKDDLKVDNFILMASCLLHDLIDSKYQRVALMEKSIDETLARLGVKEPTIDLIMYTIKNISYRDSINKSNKITFTDEMKVLSDAEKFDCLGAIGISRTFAYGGHKGKQLHIPSEEPVNYVDKEHYVNNDSTMLNHFPEKLFKLKDMFYTKSAKVLVETRHQYLVDFYEKFINEWSYAMYCNIIDDIKY